MSEITSPILFDAAVGYANETSDATIRGDLRIAFVAGAEWQWKRDAALEAENDALRELVGRAQAIVSTSIYPNWHASARAALEAAR